MSSRFSPEILNAYVDGELSASERACVANAIASDPDLARQVASLSSLKASMIAADCGVSEAFDIDLESPARRRSSVRWVAATAAILITGALVATLILNGASLLPDEGLRLARKVHESWLLQQERPETRQRGKTFVTLPKDLLIDAYVPDLTRVDLVFSGVRRVSAGSFGGMHIGYQGPNGCKVSLVVLDKTIGLSPDLARFEKNGRITFGWQVNRTGFYLLANKMDPLRLAEVARVVNRLTREKLPLDTRSIIALEEARSAGEPCLV